MKNFILKFLSAILCTGILFTAQIQAQGLKHEIDSLNNIPNQYVFSNIRKSIKIFSENLKKAKSIDYEYGAARSLYKLGLAYFLNGKYDKNLEVFIRSIEIFEKLDSLKDLAVIYGEYGYQMKKRDREKAKYYMWLGINIAEKHNYQNELTALYDNYGVIQEMSDNPDSALIFYRKALQLKKDLNMADAIPYSLNNIAGIYTMQGRYKKALEYLSESDEYRNKEDVKSGRAENLANRGDIYSYKGDVDSALFYYKKSLALADSINYRLLVRYCYEQIANLYEKKGEYRDALDNFKKFSAYKDSILNKETNEKIAELEIDYETEKKDRVIAENKLEIRTQSEQLYIAIGTIFLLTILAVGIYLYQKQKGARIERELSLENQLRQADMERKIADEKLKVSRELHDNIGSQLTFLISSLDNIVYTKEEEKVFDKLTNLSGYSRNTLKELRNTIWAMRNENADLNQLVLKLNEMKKEINNNISSLHMEVLNDIDEQVALGSSQILNLYRIVQEAVQNVIRYADATKIIVKFEKLTGGFSMQVSDNGKGFDLENVESGNGLKNMKYRCEEAGGNFRINSSSAGTGILCHINKD